MSTLEAEESRRTSILGTGQIHGTISVPCWSVCESNIYAILTII